MKHLFIIMIVLAALTASAQDSIGNIKGITAGAQLSKASSILVAGAALTGLGVITAVAVPYYFADDDPDLADKVKTTHFVGCGLVLLGTIFEFASIPHFKLAGKKIDAKLTANGIGVSMKF
jgi:hypothetical protein